MGVNAVYTFPSSSSDKLASLDESKRERLCLPLFSPTDHSAASVFVYASTTILLIKQLASDNHTRLLACIVINFYLISIRLKGVCVLTNLISFFLLFRDAFQAH